MTAPPTRQEQHERIFDTFVYEMFCQPEPEPKPRNKSPASLCKRAKFLAKPANRKGKYEANNEMPPMQRSAR
jgi:hypothetical protein